MTSRFSKLSGYYGNNKQVNKHHKLMTNSTNPKELSEQLYSEEQSRHPFVSHVFYGPEKKAGASGSNKEEGRVLHAGRQLQMNSKCVWLNSDPVDEPENMPGNNKKSPPKSLTNRLSAASKLLTRKMAYMTGGKNSSSKIHENSFCDGCGTDPIIGDMWTCSECSDFNLCNVCYQNGVHGFENNQLLLTLSASCYIENIVEKCRQRVSREVFELLFKDVCLKKMDKFKFLANWIVGVVLGYDIKKLHVRGIEIPNLTDEIRQALIEGLVPKLCEFSEFEISMEWFKPELAPSENKESQLQNLRLWVSNGNETHNPFHTQQSKATPTSIVDDQSVVYPSPRLASPSSNQLDAQDSIETPELSDQDEKEQRSYVSDAILTPQSMTEENSDSTLDVDEVVDGSILTLVESPVKKTLNHVTNSSQDREDEDLYTRRAITAMQEPFSPSLSCPRASPVSSDSTVELETPPLFLPSTLSSPETPRYAVEEESTDDVPAATAAASVTNE